MESTVTSYDFWKAAVAHKDGNGPRPEANEGNPQSGFYRIKRGDRWLPVAVFPLNGGLAFKIGAEVVGPQMGAELWTHYLQYPVTEAEYRKVAERGEDWSDADPVVSAVIAAPKPATLPEQIAEARKGLAAYAKIESDEQQARAAGLRNLLLKLRKDADDTRAARKKPHLDAGKAVDEEWRKPIAEAQDGADALRKAMESWEDHKRSAAEAAAKATQAAQEAAAKAAGPAGIPEGAPKPVVTSNLPPPTGQGQVRPTYGKAASVSTRLVLESVDVEKFLAALRGDPAKGEPKKPQWAAIVQACNELATHMANQGIVVDGMTTREGAKIR